MRKAGGYAIICDPCAPIKEMDTFTCHHCDRIVHVEAKANVDDLGGMCRICMKLVCPRCVDAGTCTPLEKRLTEQENKYHTLKSYGLVD